MAKRIKKTFEAAATAARTTNSLESKMNYGMGGGYTPSGKILFFPNPDVIVEERDGINGGQPFVSGYVVDIYGREISPSSFTKKTIPGVREDVDPEEIRNRILVPINGWIRGCRDVVAVMDRMIRHKIMVDETADHIAFSKYSNGEKLDYPVASGFVQGSAIYANTQEDLLEIWNACPEGERETRKCIKPIQIELDEFNAANTGELTPALKKEKKAIEDRLAAAIAADQNASPIS